MRYMFAMTAAALLFLGTGSAQAQGRYYDPAQMVQSWYQTYLGRSADEPGLDLWVQQLRYGGSPAQVQAGILASDEYYGRHGYTPEGFVQGLYADVLGRSASPDEVYNWVSRLMTDGGNREQLAMEFLNAARAELDQRAFGYSTPAYRPARVVYGRAYARPYGYYDSYSYGYYPSRRGARPRFVVP